jgi:hypothetical protein
VCECDENAKKKNALLPILLGRLLYQYGPLCKWCTVNQKQLVWYSLLDPYIAAGCSKTFHHLFPQQPRNNSRVLRCPASRTRNPSLAILTPVIIGVTTLCHATAPVIYVPSTLNRQQLPSSGQYCKPVVAYNLKARSWGLLETLVSKECAEFQTFI